MSLITVFQRFPDHESCIEHLERVRWGDQPCCPHCGSTHIARKQDNDRQGRWNCHACKSSFNVLSGTVFQKTKIPLQIWFVAITLILNAKKSVSSCQLSRDLEINQKSAWYLMTRVRKAMMDADASILQGIVEADECYVGGKPRKSNKSEDRDNTHKRGRGTAKMPILGVVERNGQVRAEHAENTSSSTISSFIEKHVDLIGSLLMTDEYKGYDKIGKKVKHAIINHAAEYANGLTHTNSIEGFWALVKRGWYGQHHHYSREYVNHYVAETCYKYNNRSFSGCVFSSFLKTAISK